MKIVLETGRLILRHFVMGDLDDLYRIYAQPGTMRYIGSGQVPGYSEVKDWLQRHIDEVIPSRGYGLYAAVHRGSGRLIGRLRTRRPGSGRCGGIGSGLPDRPGLSGTGAGHGGGKGPAGLRVSDEALDRVISLIQSPNLASRRVAEKNGMHLWKWTTFRGVSDVCVYRITRKAWERIGL